MRFPLRAVRQRVERLAAEAGTNSRYTEEELFAMLDEGRQRNARGERPPQLTAEESRQRSEALWQLLRETFPS